MELFIIYLSAINLAYAYHKERVAYYDANGNRDDLLLLFWRIMIATNAATISSVFALILK